MAEFDSLINQYPNAPEAKATKDRLASEQKARDAIKAQEELKIKKEREEYNRMLPHACDKYYAGYTSEIDFYRMESGFWGATKANYYGNFIVISSGNGEVNIKGTSNGNYPHYNEYLRLSCMRLREIEK